MKTLREYIDQLDEISRRGFLKGMGAAALGASGVSAASNATAQVIPAPIGPSNDEIPTADIGKLQVIYNPPTDPFYPYFSKRRGQQGDVVVRLYIDMAGKVEQVQLLKSSGVHFLDQAAKELTTQYEFKPYIVNGRPSKVKTNVLVKFRLDDNNIKTEEELDENSDEAIARVLELSKK